ncbi:hypothetical protein ILP92_01845 [Maribius pontilimi]|uniref:Uncharacterized protein n=1 Tax=Palleronia pontilimi TaxID=1964209 RepID=A0A934MFI5_9RHOB|nr:hypothetical protein [Palleronia pontilimi]MBJ3761494.1 hypothetical protein [Palleronia pontilimi]
MTAAYATRFPVAAFGTGEARHSGASGGELAALGLLATVTLVLSGL